MIKMMPRKVCLLNPKLQLLFVCCLKSPSQASASHPTPDGHLPQLSHLCKLLLGFLSYIFQQKKQLEVNKWLLAAPGRTSHGYANKTALDENTDTAKQSDESRVQHKMPVRGWGGFGLLPSPRMHRAAWSPSISC